MAARVTTKDIQRELREEMHAAWEAMEKRYARAMARAERRLAGLRNQQLADAVAASAVKPAAKGKK